jgi:type II secretory pathway pseudopilin PulG
MVLMLLAILAAAGGLVYFKTVREREAEANVGIIETRLDAIRAAACACADKACKAAERKRLEQAGVELGSLRVPGDREAAVRASVNAKFDAAVACLPRRAAPGSRARPQRGGAPSGWRTMTSVVIPPRTLNRPVTARRRGRTAARMSSAIRLVTASWKAPSSR